MSKLPQVEREIRKWQDGLLAEYQHGRTIHFRSLLDRICIAYSEDPPAGKRTKAVRTKFHGILPRVKAIVVGLDIREYSRRDAEQQLFLTLNLHVSIARAIRLLRQSLILPPHEPPIIIQTGDGAYVVFTLLEAHDPSKPEQQPGQQAYKDAVKNIGETQEWNEEDWKKAGDSIRDWVDKRQDSEFRYLPMVAGRAMSFVFALNSIMSNDNARQGFVADSPSFAGKSAFPAFPAESRFAVSFDEVLLLMDVNGVLNCVGHGMVTCARILSTDHGNHLLMDHDLLRALERHGGLQTLCGGEWEHRLHSALLNDVKVKSGQFRYADVFGFYTDRPLLQALRRSNQKPVLYHIGSHNVSSIDSA